MLVGKKKIILFPAFINDFAKRERSLIFHNFSVWCPWLIFYSSNNKYKYFACVCAE